MKYPKTEDTIKFLLITRQVLQAYNTTSDKDISLALGQEKSFFNRISNGYKPVTDAIWAILYSKYPEAQALATSTSLSNSVPTSRKTGPVFNIIVNQLIPEQFEIPRSQPANSQEDFPAYLTSQLDNYVAYYADAVEPQVNSVRKHGDTESTQILRIVTQLTDGIKQAVKFHYEGKLLRAAQTFHDTLNRINLPRLTDVETFPRGRTFYRTRHNSERPLTRKELFHPPFEKRGTVATNRYSIPGLPALYLGDSTYVCWEEYNRKDFRNLYFSRFYNTEELKMVKIQRLPDLITQLSADNNSEERRLIILARYLSLFPLSIACSIRTQSTTDVFKPEYIIPQLLLQYVTDSEGKNAAGIMYPSTKVNYTKIEGVPAYNYVFPVRQVKPQEYCSDLARIFTLTNPTSTELEALTNFSKLDKLPQNERLVTSGSAEHKRIVVAEEETSYDTTAFGFLERVLRSRPTEYI